MALRRPAGGIYVTDWGSRGDGPGKASPSEGSSVRRGTRLQGVKGVRPVCDFDLAAGGGNVSD